MNTRKKAAFLLIVCAAAVSLSGCAAKAFLAYGREKRLSEKNKKELVITYNEELKNPDAKAAFENYLTLLINKSDISEETGVGQYIIDNVDRLFGKPNDAYFGPGTSDFTGEAEILEVRYEGENYVFISSRIAVRYREADGSVSDMRFDNVHETLLKKENGKWIAEKDETAVFTEDTWGYSESVWEAILKDEFPDGQPVKDESVEIAKKLVKEYIEGPMGRYMLDSDEDRKKCAENVNVFFSREEHERLIEKCLIYGGAEWNAEYPVFVICAELDKTAEGFTEEEWGELAEQLFIKSAGGERGYFLVFPGETEEEYRVKAAALYW